MSRNLFMTFWGPMSASRPPKSYTTVNLAKAKDMASLGEF